MHGVDMHPMAKGLPTEHEWVLTAKGLPAHTITAPTAERPLQKA